MIERLFLPDSLKKIVIEEARAGLPNECCGLIEGSIDVGVAHATAVHPARNLAGAPDRFEIDPAEQIAHLKRLRGTDRDIIGCYHSHPNGRAEPSAHDREQSFGQDFIWLIVGVSQDGRDATLAAFILSPDSQREVAIVK